jgi:hypothetical protein
MHQLVPLKVKLWLIVGLGVLVSAAAHKWFGQNIYALGTVVGVVEFVVILLMLLSWRWLKFVTPYLPFLPAWAKVDLSGQWRGTIQSQWKKSPDDPALPPIPARLNLHQSWEEVVFMFDTDKMHSRSSPATPSYDRSANELQFRYFFDTQPTAAASLENPPQQMGSAVARLNLAQPDKLTIRYTNERGHGGDILLERAL